VKSVFNVPAGCVLFLPHGHPALRDARVADRMQSKNMIMGDEPVPLKNSDFSFSGLSEFILH